MMLQKNYCSKDLSLEVAMHLERLGYIRVTIGTEEQNSEFFEAFDTLLQSEGSASMKPNVAIIGLGLIGGSLGLALKRNPDLQVTGYDRSFSTLEQAFRRGIIDTIATSIENACEHADVIIFATPVNTTVAIDAASGQLEIKR